MTALLLVLKVLGCVLALGVAAATVALIIGFAYLGYSLYRIILGGCWWR